jgi:cobalt/nickel transport system permease protein
MSEKRWFILYLFSIVFLGVIHNIWLMLGVILLALLVNKEAKWRIFKKAFLALVIFNGTVTLSYLLYSLFVPIENSVLLLINLRALAITLLTFTLMHHINFHKVLTFNHTLSILYAFTYSQMMHLKKMLQEYYFGLKSRGVTYKSSAKKEQIQPLLETLFGTMLHKSNEQSLGLRSRGLLDD